VFFFCKLETDVWCSSQHSQVEMFIIFKIISATPPINILLGNSRHNVECDVINAKKLFFFIFKKKKIIILIKAACENVLNIEVILHDCVNEL